MAAGLAYVASRSGVQILDVRDPASPKEVGVVELPGEPVAITLDGNHAYVAVWGASAVTGSLAVLDIADPGAAHVVGNFALPSAPFDVTVSEELVYVGDGDGGLFILSSDVVPEPTQTPSPSALPTAAPSPTATPAPGRAVFLPVLDVPAR